jgi:hypothetical protein
MTLKYSKGPWWIAPFSIPKQQNTQIGIFGIETIPSYNPYQNRNFKKNNKKIFEQTNIFLLEQFNYKFSFCFDIKFCPKYFVRNYSNKIRHSSLFFEIIRTKFNTVHFVRNYSNKIWHSSRWESSFFGIQEKCFAQKWFRKTPNSQFAASVDGLKGSKNWSKKFYWWL